jgi:hypothetical protein
MNISTKLTFLAHFGCLMDHISALENLMDYSKIDC